MMKTMLVGGEDDNSDVVAEIYESGDDESNATIDADERGDSDDDVVEVTGVAGCSSSKFHSVFIS